MRKLFRYFSHSQLGATAIEYGLIAGILSIVIIGGSGSIKSALDDSFSAVSQGVSSANKQGN